MKCKACDVILSDSESSLKYEHGEYIDLCYSCLNEADIYCYETEEETENECS